MLTQGKFRTSRRLRSAGLAAALALGLGFAPWADADAAHAAPAEPAGNPWDTRDSATIAPADAIYLLAGSSYGDPSGSATATGHLVYSSAQPGHLTRPSTNIETLRQALQATESIGGSGFISAKSATKSKLEFDLPAGASYVLDLAGDVQINGADAFHLTRTGTGWTTTATGTQVRAFLAGFMQGEGNHDGKVGDDPTRSHLALIQNLMATPEAYDVPTDLFGARYSKLYVRHPADYPKVQAYPFIVYGRCPGGRPS